MDEIFEIAVGDFFVLVEFFGGVAPFEGGEDAGVGEGILG